MKKRIELNRARCPQCTQELSESDWAEECGHDADIVLECETSGCPKAGADNAPLWLFTVQEHLQYARTEDPCDQIDEEAVHIGVVDDGIVYLKDESDAFKRAFPELCS